MELLTGFHINELTSFDVVLCALPLIACGWLVVSEYLVKSRG